ncbi:putative gustatory receptor 28b [Anopheles funestus]|uniref:putative gustatory receptor 28b n=1 Tax=Anopheles funestus TaxID=62324 RepID=UPI0020C5EEA2|nr:putative gustatory receptor 28b [Anopheles funestus]
MVQFSLNYIFVVVLYLQVLFNPSTLLHVLNELIECAQAILRYTYSSREFTVGRRLLFKMIAIDVLQAFSWYGIFIWLQRTFGLSYVFAFWLNTIAVMQIVSATNILLAVLLWGAFLYRLINERVQIIIDNLVEMVDPAQRRDSANHDRRIVFNRIYRQLNILRTHHNALTSSIQNIVQFYDVPLALAMLYQFLIIISEFATTQQIFYAYTSIVQDIKNDVDVPLGTYMSSILFAAFEAIQFYYIISASSEITEQAEKTGILLNEFMPTAPNQRVERCIESFTIELLHQDFKINNYGMFDVDYTLMFSMIATITSYLIMLVQFQLAEI